MGTTTFKLSNTTPESIGENYARTARENYKKTVIDESHWNGETEKNFSREYISKNGDEGYTGHYKTKQTYTFKFSDDTQLVLNYYITYSNGWTSKTTKIDGSNGTEVKRQRKFHQLKLYNQQFLMV